MADEYKILGKPLVRKDAIEKANGTALYIADIHLPGMLFARYLRCPHAHARIVNIDTSTAEKLPGVKCVLTHKNVPPKHPMRKFELLLDPVLHHPGEEVAAVAAISPEVAEAALKLIKVDYEVLPSVCNYMDAMKPGAPLVQDGYGTNVYHGTDLVKLPRIGPDGWLRLDFGDVDKGFKEADYIIDGTFETPRQYNCSPMPRGVVCHWQGDKLTCWADTQLPLYLWRDLAGNLNLPQSSIRVIAHHAVGGYGGKSPEKTATLTAIMAKRTGRPVKSVFSRTEDFIGTHHRIRYLNYHRIGVKKDGTITSMYTKFYADWGSDSGTPYVCQGTASLDACNIFYRWKNSKSETQAILSNTLGYGPMNGFGDPEAIISVERIIDMAAEKINMDPVKFRLSNCIRYGDKAMEYEQVLHGPLRWGILGHDMDSFPEIIRQAAEAAHWKEKWKGWRTPVEVNGYRRKGIGVALGLHHCTYWPSSAIVKMNQDGTATVLSGAVEIGQGYGSIICQIVAEALGIRYDDVNAITADTGAAPVAIGNVASSGTSSPANACKLAAEDVRRKLFALAAPRLDTSPDNLEARDRAIWIKGSDKKIPIADICFTNWQIVGEAVNPPYHAIRDPETGKIIHAFAGAATIVEVEVDTQTGKVDVLNIATGHDCGLALNPVVVENQIDLGLVMALGWARTEEYIVDPNTGIVVNPNLIDYKLPTFLDIPARKDLNRVIVEKPAAWGPFGAKGFSETAMTALAPAIANAIYNAIGIRIYDGSLSPANILNAIEKARKGSASEI